MKLVHINPADVYDSLRSRGYTQVVSAREIDTLIMVSGQLPLDEQGRLVGEGDIELQTRAVYDNLRRSLRAAGADLGHVLRMTTYITDITRHPPIVRKVRAEYFGSVTPPASTMIEIPRLVGAILIEVDAIAGL